MIALMILIETNRSQTINILVHRAVGRSLASLLLDSLSKLSFFLLVNGSSASPSPSDVGSVRFSRVDVCASFVHYLLGVPKFVKIDYSRTNNWKNKKKLPVHLTSNFLQQVAIVNIFFQLVGHFTFDVSSIFVNAVNTCHVCSYVYESVCGCVFVVWVIIVSDYSEFRINYSILLFSRIVYLVCVHEFLVPCFSSCDRPFRELAPRWAFWNWKFHWGQEQATSPVSNSNSHR